MIHFPLAAGRIIVKTARDDNMDFLINPNVSYVLLILGFLTAVLALFSPGTGILEIAALAAVALAAYGIINLPVHYWALLIMFLSIIPLIMALRSEKSRRVIFLALTALAFALGSALLFRGEGWLPAVHPLLILLLTPLAVGSTWLISAKALEAIVSQPTFDPDRLVGMTGQASSDVRGQGTVYVDGEEWSATSSTFIPAGDLVRVIQRDGLTLIVEPLESSSED